MTTQLLQHIDININSTKSLMINNGKMLNANKTKNKNINKVKHQNSVNKAKTKDQKITILNIIIKNKKKPNFF